MNNSHAPLSNPGIAFTAATAALFSSSQPASNSVPSTEPTAEIALFSNSQPLLNSPGNACTAVMAALFSHSQPASSNGPIAEPTADIPLFSNSQPLLNSPGNACTAVTAALFSSSQPLLNNGASAAPTVDTDVFSNSQPPLNSPGNACTALVAISLMPFHAPFQSPSRAFSTTSNIFDIVCNAPVIRLATFGNTFFATLINALATGFIAASIFVNTPAIIGISFWNTCITCSAIGVTYVCTPLANADSAFFTFPAADTKVSNAATPFSPKVSLIFWRIPSRFPLLNMFFTAFVTFPIAVTALSNTATPFSPNTFPIASRISPR